MKRQTQDNILGILWKISGIFGTFGVVFYTTLHASNTNLLHFVDFGTLLRPNRGRISASVSRSFFGDNS